MNSDAPPTLAFCRRWLEKAAQYDDSTLEGAFDKFFSLFVAFNRLYSYVNRHAAQPAKEDRGQAITVFSKALGARRLLDALTSGNGAADIHVLRDLIGPCGEFFLISESGRGSSDTIENWRLFENLNSTSRCEQVNAVLTYLYLVRCNMFHGAKDFEHRQLKIIRPSVRVLERVIRAGLSVVEADAV